MEPFSPFCPVDIRVLSADEGTFAAGKMLSAHAHRLLVFTSKSLLATLSVNSFIGKLQKDGHDVFTLTIASNPSVTDLSATIVRLREQAFSPTCVLAIGGGSCLDMAKAVSALWYLPLSEAADTNAIRHAIRTQAYRQSTSFIDWIAMPTTTGTGSEVTPWATVWDTEQCSKLSIDSIQLFAKAAILIPDWMTSMPASLTLSTGLDAVSHAMEAFWAKARSPLSQTLALRAVQIASVTLPQVLQCPVDIELRREMCMASLLAGLAFSLTRTTACHSISYPLTLLHHVPHGFAAAITLAEVLDRNRAAVPEIAQLENIFCEFGGLDSWLSGICEKVQPLRLSAFHITEAHLPAIAKHTFTQGRMDNNPLAFSPQDVMNILFACL